MSIPKEVRTKFYALRIVAVALIVFAGVLLIGHPHNLSAKSLGMLAIFACILIARYSNATVWRARGQPTSNWSPANQVKRVGPLPWVLTVLSLIACVIFYYLMYLNLDGGNALWPVWGFFFSGLVLAAITSYIAYMTFR